MIVALSGLYMAFPVILHRITSFIFFSVTLTMMRVWGENYFTSDKKFKVMDGLACLVCNGWKMLHSKSLDGLKNNICISKLIRGQLSLHFVWRLFFKDFSRLSFEFLFLNQSASPVFDIDIKAWTDRLEAASDKAIHYSHRVIKRCYSGIMRENVYLVKTAGKSSHLQVHFLCTCSQTLKRPDQGWNCQSEKWGTWEARPEPVRTV